MKKDDGGAIVVEATLSLTAFVFAIFTLLSIVNIYYIQSKMSVALNSAAKEISQYSYLYYKLNVDEFDSNMTQGTEDAHNTAEKTIDGIGGLMDSLSDAENSISSNDFDSLVSAIESGTENVDSLITMYGDRLADDPKGFIIGMGKMAGNELREEVKVVLGKVLAKTFMKKNLKAFKEDDPEQFLRRYRVVDGIDGLDFDYTTLMAYGTSNQIQLCVTYDVSVIRLLNIDFKFKFRQVAKTTAWGNGISLIHPDTSTPMSTSIWDDPNDMQRGKVIVLEEKRNYDYTASMGYDAYNNAGGSNEFISIISINTHDESYASSQGITNKISSAYNSMYENVSGLQETINVQDKTGKTVEINSNPSTRTYKVIIVVPDDADMTTVQEAKNQFESSHNGAVVEIHTGYGSPSTQ